MAIHCLEHSLTFRWANTDRTLQCWTSVDADNELSLYVQVKRRWDDDVVFKNQARGEPKVQKRFINDTIRSDFHRRFLTRYIK